MKEMDENEQRMKRVQQEKLHGQTKKHHDSET
jgi:hypothetical protein